MKNAEMKKTVTVNDKELAPDIEAILKELEDAVKRARSHRESCDCEDCETKKDFGLSRLKGFGKKIGGFFVSTKPLEKPKKVSEAEAEEIEDDRTNEATADEAEVETEEVNEAEKVDTEAEKVDAETTKTEETKVETEKDETKTTKIGIGGGFKKPKKESEYIQLFYTDSGKLLSSDDIEKIKKLPVSKNPISINKVEKFTVQLEGGLSCDIEKVPRKAESRAFLHVMSRTLISKDDADLYNTYCTGNMKDDPVIKVEKICAHLTDENGLEKLAAIDNF